VRRRICLLGVTLPLALGVAPAVAATSSSSKPVKPKPVKTVCTTNVGIMIASGGTEVTPPVQAGQEYGSAHCGPALGGGVQSDTFTVDDSGDTLAKFTWYLHTGTVHGTYDLTPQSGAFNFLAVDYTGTLKVKGGTGAFAGAKGTGTMTCSTADGIHTTCSDKVKLTQL